MVNPKFKIKIAYVEKREDENLFFEIGQVDPSVFTAQSYWALLIDKDTKRKELIYAIAEQFVMLTSEGLNLSNHNMSGKTTQYLDLNIAYFLKNMSYFVGYFINCSSYRDQELHDYDKMELRSRLEKLMHHLK